MIAATETLSNDPAEIARRVISSVDRFVEEHRHWDEPEWFLLKKELARWLRRLEPPAAFEALVRILEQCPGLLHQALVAELLSRMGRRCPLPREAMVRRVAACFNLSAKHLPFYLEEQYGREAVLGDLDVLRSGSVEREMVVRIDSIKWWLGARA